MSGLTATARSFELDLDGRALAGETVAEGPAIVCAHGVTATRSYVLHGSVALARNGYTQVLYDARGHGESDPPPPGEGYAYPLLAADLGEVIASRAAGGKVVLAGHSLGAHTIVNRALADPDGIAGLVVIGPVQTGAEEPQSTVERWDRLADGLDRGGVEGFMEAFDRDLDPRWREVILRFTRQRISAHRHPRAVAAAMREMPRQKPFEDIAALRALDLPALVVASHDDADPGHPYEVAEAYAEALPHARLISEADGESPLAWQGGRLSREIAAFCDEIGF